MPGSWRTFWAAGYVVLLFGKHVRTQEVKYRTHVEAGFEVYVDYAVCNLFIHIIYFLSFILSVCNKNEKYSIGRLHVLLRHTFGLVYFCVPKIWSMYIWHGIQQLSRGNNNYCAIIVTVYLPKCTKIF